jgi:hypothetical protein
LEFRNQLVQLSKVLPPIILDKIINADLYLVLYNFWESYHEVVQEVYEHAILKLGIPEHKIILMSESADILHEVKQVAATHAKLEIRVIWCRGMELSIQRYKKMCKPILTLEDKIYEKKFLNFNRRWHLHRPVLVSLMYSMGLLDKGFISLASSDDILNWDLVIPLMEAQHKNNVEISNILSTHKEEILKLPPMYLDTQALMVNQAQLDESTDYFYANTYFSVVSETNFYEHTPGRFLTEKTFKPIAQQHPFILVTRPYTLDSLRSIGYKTFSPWIDESYDTEEDEGNRLLLIAKEIKRLADLTPSELTLFLNGVRDICKYNFEVFMNKDTFITELN